jgi:hypothetical protein
MFLNKVAASKECVLCKLIYFIFCLNKILSIKNILLIIIKKHGAIILEMYTSQ